MNDIGTDICVVGGGYAGLTAALRLKERGKSVVVLEARDRVGGRTWTETLPDGTWIDRGGAWIGYGQDRMYALAKELGVATYPSFKDGESVFVVDGKAHRYHGVIPAGINPLSAVFSGLALRRLDRMALEVPLDAPWTAPRAREWDRQTVGHWIASSFNVPTRRARDVMNLLITDATASTPDELSLLGILFFSHSLGGFEKAADTREGTQKDRIVGGMQTMARLMAERIGKGVRLSSPARRIAQDARGVTVTSDNVRVRARRVVVAMSPFLSARITYDPLLPDDRNLLAQRVPHGWFVKIAAVYEDAFWRRDGLCGQSAGIGTPVVLTLDSCAVTTPPGILTAVLGGPVAQPLNRRSAEERKQVVLDDLARRFGPKAKSPIAYIEQDWAHEEWTQGYVGHFPPGALTTYGYALREPADRIHWAGTETATKSYLAIDGAVRSGERVAEEILAAAD